MLNRVIGGMLLIIGTSFGGGMLALPVVTAKLGFAPAVVLMVATWFLMTMSAFWILEVNLWLEEGCNLISMAKVTLGWMGQALAWTSYLVLLYCLLSAYIAGGADVVQHLFQSWQLSYGLSAALFVVILGTVVAYGVQSVDWVNRGLLAAKLVAFFLLVALMIGHIKVSLLAQYQFAFLGMAIMPAVTSFGYAIILPSLRTYLNGDVALLRKVIAVGSLVPLIFYIIWEMGTLGTIQLEGEHGLGMMYASGHSTSDLMAAIGEVSHSAIAHSILKVFTSICVGTSFLGVSLAMKHFLHDGLSASNTKKATGLILLLMYVPPVIMVLFFPNAFIMGLSYAGICCVILLMLLPAAMVYSGRYCKKIATGYQTWGGRSLPILVMVVSVGLILFNVTQIML